MEFGKLHVLLVHFPIALGLSAALADAIWLILKKDFFRQAGLYCLILAALAAIPAVIAGDMHLESEIYLGQMHQIAETHETLGYCTLGVLIAATLLRSIRKNRLAGAWLGVYGVIVLAAVALISLTGYYGGELTHGTRFLSGLLGG